MWIKICGITNSRDAATAVAAGANAIGLNFYPASPRYVQADQAREIVGEIGDEVDVVGVFVNDAPQHTAQIAHEIGLTAVQMHGDETSSDIQKFQILCPETSVIRAFRIGTETTSFEAQWQDYDGLRQPLAAALVDAWSAEEYGGTGRTVPEAVLDGHHQLTERLILAGGLTPDNVALAVSTIRPWGVDTASGVESAPGIKSAVLIQRFVAACRGACPDVSLNKLTLKWNV